MRYEQIAKSHNISLSEWMASILSMYQNAYGGLKINSIREEELLYEIEKLRKKINLLEAQNNFLEATIDFK
jgi:hypothetical protein